ncbi:MAG: hypothetical protein J3Q66DRAFT_423387 [Benniella sp.]|nr:MAG: hypothetical protein J3Q66DRAFT_423387 [Benniella sp.]
MATANLDCFYRDRLVYNQACSTYSLSPFASLDIFQWDKHQFAKQDFTIPEPYDTLERIDYDQVSREEFIERFEEKSIPTFLKKYFKVGEDDDGNNVYLKMKYFLKYGMQTPMDSRTTHIFDSGVVKRTLTTVQEKRISVSCSSSSASSSPERSIEKSPMSRDPESSSNGGEGGTTGNKRVRSRSDSPTSKPKKVISGFWEKKQPQL